MITIDSKLLISYYVKNSVKNIAETLSKRFNSLYNMPIMYYDWSSGFSEVFKQNFAKIPQNFREKPWFTLAYSYGSPKHNSIQPRALLDNYIPIYSNNGVTVAVNALTRLVTVSILCTALTNDGNYADSIALSRTISQSYWKNITCPDIFYPQWKPQTEYPKNFIVIPKVPNGYVYISQNEGVSSDIQLNWPTNYNDTVLDGNITWLCAKPRESKMEMHDFTLPDIKSPNVYTDGIRYGVEFSYALTFVGLEDAEYQLSTLKGFDNHLYSVIENALR